MSETIEYMSYIILFLSIEKRSTHNWVVKRNCIMFSSCISLQSFSDILRGCRFERMLDDDGGCLFF